MRFALHTLLVSLVLLTTATQMLWADDFSGSGPMVYRQRQSQAQVGTLAGNVLRIINTSGRTSEYTLRVSAASEFQILGQRDRTFSLVAGDTLFVPVRASIRYFHYALNLRYYYGPYYSNELRRFAQEEIRSNRFSAGFNFDHPMLQGTLLFRLSSLYNFTTYNKQSILSLRP